MQSKSLKIVLQNIDILDGHNAFRNLSLSDDRKKKISYASVDTYQIASNKVWWCLHPCMTDRSE